MRLKLCIALTAALVVGLQLSTAQTASGDVIERKSLVATPHVQRWESADHGGVVWVRIFAGGEEVEQTFINSCSARYQTRTLAMLLHSKECKRPGRHPFVLRYVSFAGKQRFRVRLSDSNP